MAKMHVVLNSADTIYPYDATAISLVGGVKEIVISSFQADGIEVIINLLPRDKDENVSAFILMPKDPEDITIDTSHHKWIGFHFIVSPNSKTEDSSGNATFDYELHTN